MEISQFSKLPQCKHEIVSDVENMAVTLDLSNLNCKIQLSDKLEHINCNTFSHAVPEI